MTVMGRDLKAGHYFKGPEPAGCFNSGTAPVISRPKRLKQYTGKTYIVGRELDVLFRTTGLILSVHDTVSSGKAVKPKLYTSKAKAFKEFERQCQVIIDSNTETVSKVKELKQKPEI